MLSVALDLVTYFGAELFLECAKLLDLGSELDAQMLENVIDLACSRISRMEPREWPTVRGDCDEVLVGVPGATVVSIVMPGFAPMLGAIGLDGPSAVVVGNQGYGTIACLGRVHEVYAANRLWADGYFLAAPDVCLEVLNGSSTKILVSSSDVIHSLAFPELGIKLDAIPGHITSTYLAPEDPGYYHGQCSEFCGAGHAFMPFGLVVLESCPEGAMPVEVTSNPRVR